MKKALSREEIMKRMLKLIRKNPGIRPRELHRMLGLEHSASIRGVLIKRGLVRKERRGSAVHYYAVASHKSGET